jgi:hypothetical protein
MPGASYMLMPVILVTREAEIKRISIPEPISKTPNTNKGSG